MFGISANEVRDMYVEHQGGGVVEEVVSESLIPKCGCLHL